MERDDDRVTRIRRALEAHRLDAIVCTLPANVRMATGYWPVIGNTVAVATSEGAVGLLAPEDEAPFASNSWADSVETFEGGSLHTLASTADTLGRALPRLLTSLAIRAGAKIGFEGTGSFDPSSYASTFVYGAGLPHLLHSAAEGATLTDATDCLLRLRAVLTDRELAVVRKACSIARSAYIATVPDIHVGMREFEIAAVLRGHLAAPDAGERCDGFAYCMSGPNAARAYAAFQHSTARAIVNGDLVLLHCNSFCDGLWTDVTRTFSIGPPDREQRQLNDAVLMASQHAVAAIRPAVRASMIDDAARAVMRRCGFGDAFRHATGHGVGFSAIDHQARPRIHPLSNEVLEVGMVFNVEPAAYLPGTCGIRHCDMVAVTEGGAELLTPFLSPPPFIAPMSSS
jgi:Xaa-Pro aminopeptidase